jgi:hypothetical protein
MFYNLPMSEQPGRSDLSLRIRLGRILDARASGAGAVVALTIIALAALAVSLLANGSGP